MKKTSQILAEFGDLCPHGSMIEPVMQESLQIRIRRMVKTHIVETPVGLPDFDDPENEPSKSMDLRPEADFHSDRFDKAEALISSAETKYKEQQAQAEIARRAKLAQTPDTGASVKTEPTGSQPQ